MSSEVKRTHRGIAKKVVLNSYGGTASITRQAVLSASKDCLRTAGLILDVSDEECALADLEAAATVQVAGVAGPEVGLSQVAAAEECGDLVGVDLVVLGLAAVDGQE